MDHINKTILKQVYKKRNIWCHKGDFGSLLVIGGSKLYSGSPAFNALAALRAGCDLVTIVAPERAANIAAGFCPDMITYPLKGDYLSKKHLTFIMNSSKDKDAVVIGGGLGRNNETLRVVNGFLKHTNLPCVIDADAIHAVAKNKSLIKKNFVITPHTREFYALTGLKATNDINDRIEKTKKAASRLGCTILLKGHIDVISDGKNTAINKTGSPFMTKGGTGDTLAGICGALLARGAGCFDAACAAAYINGLAGGFAAEKYGESMLASDLIGNIPNVLNQNKL